MIDPNDRTRFEPYTIHSTPYKSAFGQPITVDVFYPTKLLSDSKALSAPRPVVIRFHGGGLITGSSLYAGMFSDWFSELIQKHNAIVVSAENQLFPEASPADILSDVTDIWQWTQSSLAAYLETQTHGAVKPDLSRIITSGESAGGLLSLLLALEQPDSLRAVLAQYPMIDLKSPHFTEEYDKKPFGQPMSNFPVSLIEDLIKTAKDHKARTGTKLVVATDPQLKRLPAMFSAMVHGTFKDFIQNQPGGEDLYVYDRLRQGAKLPRDGVFVWHGSDDTLVPVDGSRELEKVVRETNPDVKFSLLVQPGEHGFDSEAKLQDAWVLDAIAEIERVWLS